MSILETGEISVEGRLVDASNATLLVTISKSDESIRAIYKPIAGERPLWDFPDGDLASRERAAYLIDQSLGFNHVPHTVLRDGPFGVGMVQKWIEIDDSIDLEEYFLRDDVQLRQVALFDAIVNNTDRKIGHLIPTHDGHLYICDHGVTFHVDDKLRTVLWQWAGQTLTEQEKSALRSLDDSLAGELSMQMRTLLTHEELIALHLRIQRLIETGIFPHPNPEWPHIPWPPF